MPSPVRPTDAGALAAVARDAAARQGPITVLVAAAGVSETAPLAKTPVEMLRRIMAVDVEGVLFAIHTVLPGMLAAGHGRIVVIASTASFKGYTYASASSTRRSGGFARWRSKQRRRG